ncbi:MAG TPA: response regulator [Caldithrix abyssi]|uniref:Response regulator n=1 Tax=Caldithrix abyssi TaxID=187145 RepID=A0A7V4U521_CALAY|nr:response regulator [Caldithrix abyssi]
MGHKILIVDDNPNVLRLLNISLSKAPQKYEIIEAENGEIAYELANKEKPDLIISDIMMPQMDGIELCWMIRENSEIPLVPFIFLTSFDDAEMEIRGFRAGADEYLNKPIDRKELLSRVEELLARTQNLKSIEKKSEAHKGFSGDLKDLSIVELVQMLNLNKKSGILHIHSDEEGRIYLKDGQLYAVEAGDLQGEEAMYKLVAKTEGTFSFELTDITIEPNIHNSTMNVIMEACRIMDETHHKDQHE